MLVNVNLVDKERAKKNVELRKKKPDYLPYAEGESVDDLAQAGGSVGAGAGDLRSGGYEELVALWLFRSQAGPNLYLLPCSKNRALSWPSTMRSWRASGRTPSVWSREELPMAFGNVSWKRSGPSCGCKLSP